MQCYFWPARHFQHHENPWQDENSCRKWNIQIPDAYSRLSGRFSPGKEQPQCRHNNIQLAASLQTGLGYFNYILVTSVAFLLCAWHKVQGMFTIWKCLVENRPSFIKLVSWGASSVPWPHWCNSDSLNYGWSIPNVFAVQSLSSQQALSSTRQF